MHKIDELLLKGEDFSAFSNTLPNRVTENFLGILKNINIKKLIELGTLSDSNPHGELYYLLNELGHQTLFRVNQKTDNILSNIWLAKVTSKAKEYYLENPGIAFDRRNLNNAFMKKIVNLSEDIYKINNIQEYLKEIGILLVFEKYIPNSLVDGVCFRLMSGNPIIGISLRFDRLDNFWFTLMHELAHVHLHYDILETPILDNMESLEESDLERQANIFAKFSIIDKAAWRTCDALIDKSKESLLKFAQYQNVHPALIAGLIRHELNDYAIFSDIVQSVKVRDILGL
ncbi:ImmA/IrrE family metallo-endopeptidase [Leptospira selangorensis]|uniref:ImmA/IrrE family metallo-endopeptidase n=1 Tax=Leptospira selangorensis TaxID=2484982 RepID=A0A5F2C6H2_9LEPT|nr:ImmA/IrrE family metallo-endopeptidase [Leptospira selangorensis]TGM10268.1 ImmA/IrrE family metallo-endopeptidase [Leptospira selangorensis]TGM27929.1 ImmA/IrrE family metallo-endopeptidase [Leptospira selangorensis]